MNTKPFDASKPSLYKPGEADDFFQLDSIEHYHQNEAGLCAEMSRLAYVKNEDRLNRYLDRIGFQKDLAIGFNVNGTQLFIASKTDVNITIVSFRGTEMDDPSDLFTNANFMLSTWKDKSGQSIGKVHTGFAEALTQHDILNEVMECINSKAPTNRILLTGHSLGAALATLTASWLPSALLYTFGSPRVGNPSFASLNLNHKRFVDCCDMVTEVPFENLGYVHSGSLQYINRKGQILESPSESEINSDHIQAKADYFTQQAFLRGTVAFRELADHAPVNYVSAVMGLRIL